MLHRHLNLLWYDLDPQTVEYRCKKLVSHFTKKIDLYQIPIELHIIPFYQNEEMVDQSAKSANKSIKRLYVY